MSILDDIIAHYDLDETSGVTVSDSSVNENDGSVSHVRVLNGAVSGLLGTCADLTQGNDTITLAEVEQTGAFTMNVWFKTSNSSTQDLIGSNGHSRAQLRNGGAIIRFVIRNGTSGDKNVGNWANDEWNMLTLRYEGSGGVARASFNGNNLGTIPVGSVGGSPNVNIGHFGFSYGDFLADHVTLWQRYISDEEIDDLYNSGEGLEFPFSGTPTPSATTQAADEITSSTARLNGELTEIGEEDDVDVFFQYREDGESTWLETTKQNLSSTGTFNSTVSSLAPGLLHEFRAVVEWDDGEQTELGSILTFTTDEAPSPFFDVSITSTNSPVGQGNELQVNVNVENTGAIQGSQNVTLRFGTQGNVVDTIENITLDPDADTDIQLTYTIPSEQSPSSYTVWVQSDDGTASTSVTVTETLFGTVELTLPLADEVPEGKYVVIKDETGEASLHNIIIRRKGSDLIDGEEQIIITSNYASVGLISNGTDKWHII